MKSRLVLMIGLSLMVSRGFAQEQAVQVTVSLADRLGLMHIDRMALGQGGLSQEPMWDDRIAEIRALRPAVIRLFIQEYFDLLPAPGRYHFDTLDQSVGTILKTGAEPVMCICFKPKVLFPVVDHDIVEPNDYGQWEELIFRMVRHYQQRDPRIRYWEVANEPDIGESGGCPYRFQPENYTRYYRHTVEAILRADPDALVGGPALANSRSPILPKLLEFCEKENVPLHFVSWHIYSSSPQQVRDTITYGPIDQAPGHQGPDDAQRMERRPLAPAGGPTISAVLRGRGDLADEGRGARLLLLLSHSRLARCVGAIHENHVAPGGGVHVPLVESPAAIRRVVRLPERDPARLLHVQAPLPADRRTASADFEKRFDPRPGDLG